MLPTTSRLGTTRAKHGSTTSHGTSVPTQPLDAARQIGGSMALFGPDRALLASSDTRGKERAPAVPKGHTVRHNG